MLLSVQGPNEGELVLECSATDLRGSLKVEISPKVEENCVLLYRLRVKEASLLFSKTYGALANTSPHSRSEEISICAKAAVAESKNIATIRVEFISVRKEDAPVNAYVEKNDAKPFFEKGGVRHYDIRCVLKRVPEEHVPKRDHFPITLMGPIITGVVCGLVALAWRYRTPLIGTLKRRS